MGLKTVKVGSGGGSSSSGSYINNQLTEQASSNFYISGSGRLSRVMIGNQSEIGDDQGSTPTRIFLNLFDSSSQTLADGNLAVYGLGVFPETYKLSETAADAGFQIAVGAESRIGALNRQDWNDLTGIGSTAFRGSCNIQVGATGTLQHGHSLFAASDIGGMSVRYLKGLFIDTPYVHGGGAVVENFAIHVKNQGNPGSYDNWNLLIEGTAKSYFEGVVGIGNSSPSTKALLDVASTTKGILIPRMTKAQRDAITSVPQGLQVFVTDNGGYLSWYNSGWFKVNSTSDP